MNAVLATKIKMKAGCLNSRNLMEIDEIYLSNCRFPKFYAKEEIHEYLLKNPRTICVNIAPYPYLVPARLGNEKYVKSASNNVEYDNLLRLPRV